MTEICFEVIKINFQNTIKRRSLPVNPGNFVQSAAANWRAKQTSRVSGTVIFGTLLYIWTTFPIRNLCHNRQICRKAVMWRVLWPTVVALIPQMLQSMVHWSLRKKYFFRQAIFVQNRWHFISAEEIVSTIKNWMAPSFDIGPEWSLKRFRFLKSWTLLCTLFEYLDNVWQLQSSTGWQCQRETPSINSFHDAENFLFKNSFWAVNDNWIFLEMWEKPCYLNYLIGRTR